MLSKIVIIFILLAIFFALASGLYFLVKEGNQGLKTVKALTWRIGLSIGLLLLLMLGNHLGWIQAHGLIQ